MKRWVKWLAFAVALVLYLVLAVRGTSLSDRAIVVGMAVDKSENGYLLSAQILIPVSGDEQSSGAGGGYVVSSVEAASLSEAFVALGEVSGKAVALSHCNLFIMGFGTLENDAYRVLDYSVRNAYLSENAFILAAEDGKNMLETNVAYGEMTSLYLQDILNERGIYSDVARRTVKEYIKSYCSHESGNWLPIIEKIETQTPEVENKENKNSAYIFKLNTTAIVRGNSFATRLTESETKGLVYLTSNVERGAITIDGDGGEKISLYIIENKPRINYDSENLEITAKLKVTALIKEVITPGEGAVSMEKHALTDAEDARFKNAISSSIVEFIKVNKQNEIDVINIYDGFYRDGKADWRKAAPDDYLSYVKINTDIEVKYE